MPLATRLFVGLAVLAVFILIMITVVRGVTIP